MGGAPRQEIIIGDARESDLREIAGIERMSFQTPWSLVQLRSELDKDISIFRVAKAAGKVVGYLCVNCIADEASVMTFAVHPDFRRGSIARRLFEDVVSLLKRRNCGLIFLEVRESNSTARKMYERFGFRRISTRRGYYRSPDEDALILMMHL